MPQVSPMNRLIMMLSTKFGLTGLLNCAGSAGSTTSTGVLGTSILMPSCSTRASRALRMLRCSSTSRSALANGRYLSLSVAISASRACLSSVSRVSYRVRLTSYSALTPRFSPLSALAIFFVNSSLPAFVFSTSGWLSPSVCCMSFSETSLSDNWRRRLEISWSATM